MAHKGKIWPYLFERDLSLAPNTIERLPQRMVWTGIVAGGSLAPLVNGKTLVSLPGLADYRGIPNVLYRWELPTVGPTQLGMSLAYYLTYDTNLSFFQWVMGDTIGSLSKSDPQFTLSTFPRNLQLPCVQNLRPARLLITGAGQINPKPW